MPPSQRLPNDPNYPQQSKIPLMLVGNKADRSTEREVSAQEGRSLATELGCLFTESSAKTCQNVELAFYEVVRQIRRQREGEKEQISGKQKAKNGKGKSRRGTKCIILWFVCSLLFPSFVLFQVSSSLGTVGLGSLICFRRITADGMVKLENEVAWIVNICIVEVNLAVFSLPLFYLYVRAFYFGIVILRFGGDF